MGTERGRMLAGVSAQGLGQALAGWATLAHLTEWPDISIWVLVPLIGAALAPFRHDGSIRDRATINFGAAVLVAGLTSWELSIGGLEGIFGGGFRLGVSATLMLAASVLFSLAGAMFWLSRDSGS